MEVISTYEPYAQHPEYIDTNRKLVDMLELDRVHTVLDAACGTGLMSQLLLQRKNSLAIRGVDISKESLSIARRQFKEIGVLAGNESEWRALSAKGSGAVLLEEHRADALPFADDSFDLAIMGNAIHLMPDKDAFLQGIHRVLITGGRFAFNSVFFVGTFADDTERVFLEWMKEALAVLDEMNRERKATGEKPVPRKRGTGGRAFDKGWLSPTQWENLMARHGFRVTYGERRRTEISRRGLELVGAYGGLAEVLMSGYPVSIASECLQRGAGRAFDRLGIAAIPRYWLEVIAEKE